MELFGIFSPGVLPGVYYANLSPTLVLDPKINGNMYGNVEQSPFRDNHPIQYALFMSNPSCEWNWRHYAKAFHTSTYSLMRDNQKKKS